MATVTRDGMLLISIPRTGSTSLLAEFEHDQNICGSFAEKHAGLAYARKYAQDLAEDMEYQNDEARFVRNFDPYELIPCSMIRNPWAWFVSMYNSAVSASPSRFAKDVWPGDLIQPADSPRIMHPQQRMGMSFPDFVRARRTLQKDWLLDADGTLGVAADNILIHEEFIKTARFTKSKLRDGDYKSWYTIPRSGGQMDQQLIDLVSRRCAWEIEFGGYTFD